MPKPRGGMNLRRIVVAALLLAGLLLRVYFVWRHAFLAGDSFLYQDIAQSWLHHGIYGFADGETARPTLIRLPGYPMILAALAWMFDGVLKASPGTLRSFWPVFLTQIAADLGTCCLAGAIARRIGGERAGLVALSLLALCPFTANYTAVPLTETFTLFFLALAFYALQRWVLAQRMRWLALLAFAVAWSVLLRPDQGLLAASVLPVVFYAARNRWRTTALLCILIALPFVPWTIRNYRTFHVFQPLAPKQATDPWETPPVGFQRWFRTWAVDFSATQDAYWKYPEDPVSVDDLPQRAFDTPQELERATTLLKAAGEEGKLSPHLESGFAVLARDRIRRHPIRYYAVLPAARLLNMLLHPRTEMLPVEERWWQFRRHPGQTLFAWGFAAMNLGYLAAAAAGFQSARRKNRGIALAMALYIALRCMLLLTLDNAEQRYTLEFFPIYAVFASGLFMQRSRVTNKNPAP